MHGPAQRPDRSGQRGPGRTGKLFNKTQKRLRDEI